MAKKKPKELTEVTIRYDLFELPTAQHKAGLAGLVLAIRSLKNRSENDPEAIPTDTVPEIVEGPTASEVTVLFTELSFTRLINDVYDADATRTVQEKPRKNKKTKENIPWLDRGPIEVYDKKADKTTTKEGYVYLDAIPRLNPIRFSLGEQAPWLKLWYDFLKSVVRDSKKWAPYRVRAAAKSAEAAKYMASSEEKDSGDATEPPSKAEKAKGDGSSWLDVVAYQVEKSKGQVKLGSLSSALLLGAQDCNAESIDFKGRVEQNILLHFWPLCSLISVPWLIDRDGKSKEVGYVAAIPEVADLKRFCTKYPIMLAGLNPQLRGRFRPAQAVIDLPAQGALEFINSVAQIKTAELDDHPIRAVNSVEFLHLDKQGNNVKLLASGRVPSDEGLLARYRDIVGTAERPSEYHNPLFKGALIQAVLRGDKPWWGELLPLFMNRDWRFFVRAKDTATVGRDISFLPWFWDDVRTRLKAELDEFTRGKENQQAMSDANANPATPPLSALLNRLVRTYVYRRAEERSNVKLPEKDIDWKSVDPRFNEEKEQVGKSLFLEFRSRRDQAFVEHFAQTFFAVKQFLKDEDQLQLADALLNKIEDVKTLTLMALSANS